MLKRLFALAGLLLGLALAAPAAFAAADVDIAVVRTTLNTSTGNQDITTADFGGGTPKAAIFILSGATADGTVTDDARGSFGATDGTNQWVTSWAADNNTPSANVWQNSATDEIAQLINLGVVSIDVEANFVSFITNGVRINVGNAGSAHLLTVILLGGTDLSAVADTATIGSEDVAVTESPGFELTALIAARNVVNFADSISAHIYQSFGVASWDGATLRQAAFIYRSDDGDDPTETYGMVNDAAVFTFPSGTDIELSNITSTSFDLTPRGTSSGVLGYLALNLANGGEAWAGVLDSPTATGNHSWTAPGIRPDFALLNPTMLSAVNTNDSAGQASGFGLSAFTADAEFSNAWADEDNQGTSDSQTVADDIAVNLDDHSGAAAFDATFVSFDANGATLNFTAADGTTRKWPALFLGDGSTPATGGAGNSLIIVN